MTEKDDLSPGLRVMACLLLLVFAVFALPALLVLLEKFTAWFREWIG